MLSLSLPEQTILAEHECILRIITKNWKKMDTSDEVKQVKVNVISKTLLLT